MRLALAVIFLASLYLITPSRAWEVDAMNKQVDATNIVLGIGGDPFCSGTIVADRIIATAAHCVREVTTTRPTTKVAPDGTVSVAVVQKVGTMDVWQNRYNEFELLGSTHVVAKPLDWDYDTDAALLQIVDENWKPVAVAPIAPSSYKVKAGQPVYIVGNPAGIFDNSVTLGIISNTRRTLSVSGGGTDTKYYETDARAIGGNSGGGAFNDKGELIGILSAGMGQTITLVVPFSEVRKLLIKNGFKQFDDKAKANPAAYPY